MIDTAPRWLSDAAKDYAARISSFGGMEASAREPTWAERIWWLFLRGLANDR